MDNESGRGASRSHEPPKLATVARLHHDEAERSSATATEEWYETERLTGHITGRAGTTPPSNQPGPDHDEQPAVLGWRHPAPPPPPALLQRLGRSLHARRERRRHKPAAAARDTNVFPAAGQEPPPAALREEEAAADHHNGAGHPIVPRIALRGDGDQAPRQPRRRTARRTSALEGGHHPGLRRGLVPGAIVLAIVLVSAVGIASQLNGTPAKPHHTTVVAATSRPGAALSTTAERAIGALESLKHQTSRSRARHRPVRIHRRLHHNPRVHTRRASRQAAVSRSASPPPAVVTAPSTGSSGSSSSAPASNPQPTTTHPAPAPTRSASSTGTGSAQPAGPTGTGAGTVGSNCNPKCS